VAGISGPDAGPKARTAQPRRRRSRRPRQGRLEEVKKTWDIWGSAWEFAGTCELTQSDVLHRLLTLPLRLRLTNGMASDQGVVEYRVPRCPYIGREAISLWSGRTAMDTHFETSTDRIGDRLVYTVAEAGALLGISRAFAYELVARGELPVIRLGRRRLVPKVALLTLVEADRTSATQ